MTKLDNCFEVTVSHQRKYKIPFLARVMDLKLKEFMKNQQEERSNDYKERDCHSKFN